jgi:predicted GNAT family acetyltransferase
MSEIIELEYNEEKGSFYIEIDGKVEAKMTFVFSGQRQITIDHTEVKPGNKGKGFGKKMIQKAVEFTREKNIKILPVCSFAKSVFDKTPEFKDVLQ